MIYRLDWPHERISTSNWLLRLLKTRYIQCVKVQTISTRSVQVDCRTSPLLHNSKTGRRSWLYSSQGMVLQPPLIKTLVEVKSARVPKSSSKCLGNKKAFIMLTNTSMNLHQQSTKESIVTELCMLREVMNRMMVQLMS